MNIRPVLKSDAARIVEIYNHYVQATTITFEEQPVSEAEMQARIENVLSADLPWLVIEEDGLVQGYAYAGPWSGRSAYRFTVEPSVYLAAEALSLGMGKRLYQHLLDTLQQLGIEQVLGVIALPNSASVGLHEAFGFKKVGEFSRIGYKFGRWLSVGYWQLSLGLHGVSND